MQDSEWRHCRHWWVAWCYHTRRRRCGLARSDRWRFWSNLPPRLALASLEQRVEEEAEEPHDEKQGEKKER
jgi:hypothetical protein